MLLQASPSEAVAAGAACDAICVIPASGVVLKDKVGMAPGDGRADVGREGGVSVGVGVADGAARAV